MQSTAANNALRIVRVGPWFIPAWAQAGWLACDYVSVLRGLAGGGSALYLYYASFLLVWCIPLIPVRLGWIKLSNACLLVCAAYTPMALAWVLDAATDPSVPR